ncbi:DUF885 domain-containing protein [Caldimonas brevitalea]|uniref:DUF885 domain-containing protein n=1 Tax=Caldimonas brevitalea TaxID=413882 RepID=A0A0G3BIY3_9BURK|nr:DUF885 domain-containing protein [Caldimonas brevitalea]AKJ27958.1 hypothetical protein AAW51_1267 [Caldimonas brevitalea]
MIGSTCRTLLRFLAIACFIGSAFAAPAAQADAAKAALDRLLAEHWEWQMREAPEWATMVGDHRYDDRLADRSPAALERQLAETRAFLKRLEAEVQPARLNDDDRVTYDVFVHHLRTGAEELSFPATATMVLSNKAGLHLDFPQLVQMMPFRTERDYRNYLARLRALPGAVDRNLEAMRLGLRIGWVTFRASLEKVPRQIDTLLVKDVTSSPLYQPLRQLPPELPAPVREALAAEARQTLEQTVAPALRRLREFVVNEYLPHSPVDGSIKRYPGGEAYYAFRVRQQTTTDLTPAQIHATGQAEVQRLRAEMEALMRSTGHRGDFASFVKWLNSDPRFMLRDANELLMRYRDIAKRVDAELPRQFAQLPRLPYGIRAIPAHEGPETPEYYTPGAADGSRAGWFNANGLALKRRPTWEMEALFLHEAVPGHHLQTARALELDKLPMLRRSGFYVAYGEGWALYAETLGGALGVYTDPYARFGQLRMEIYRAARLVVDTGIHVFGWSRQQAIDWMSERTGMRREEVAAEVDRYFVWPAQALGYKIGQLHIAGLRDRMRAALGSCFDIRRFHMAVLDQGALPLAVLDQWMARWLAQERELTKASCPTGSGTVSTAER